jgi:hypothetical protein
VLIERRLISGPSNLISGNGKKCGKRRNFFAEAKVKVTNIK